MVNNHVYQIVTPDEYELPLAQADTMRQLGDIVGVNYRTLNSNLSHMRSGKRKGYKIIKVEFDEEEEDE